MTRLRAAWDWYMDHTFWVLRDFLAENRYTAALLDDIDRYPMAWLSALYTALVAVLLLSAVT